MDERLGESARSVDYVVDTSFLVRRWRLGSDSAEQRFIAQNPDAGVAMPWIVKAEFLRGAAVARHDYDDVERFLSRFPTLWPTDQTLQVYVALFVSLRRESRMIGPHDVWIAAAALEHDLPLLTRNRREFRRVPGLRVADYDPS